MAVRTNRGQHVVEFQQRGRRIFRRLPKHLGVDDALALEEKLRRDIFLASDLGDEPEPSAKWDSERQNDEAWSRVAGILLSAGPVAPRSGVYFLCSKGRLMYVGKSKNVAARLAGHVEKDFDVAHMTDVPVNALQETELLLIRMLRPPLNHHWTGRKRHHRQ